MAIDLPSLWDGLSDQRCSFGDEHWNIARLVKAVEEHKLKPFSVDLRGLDMSERQSYDGHEFAAHMLKAQKANLKYPIILHPTGAVLDGRHRIIKALVTGEDKILAVKFTYRTMPNPDRVE